MVMDVNLTSNSNKIANSFEFAAGKFLPFDLCLSSLSTSLEFVSYHHFMVIMVMKVNLIIYVFLLIRD